MTKSINGHADVVAGCIVTQTKEMAARLRPIMITMGMCLDPNSAFLTRRGLKTLPLRVERAQDSAMRLALYLESHAKIAWVRYPGLESHPQHEVAKRIMKGPGTMLSFGLKGGLDAGKKLLNSVKLCTLAVSLGGVETLIQHPASMTHAKLSPEARRKGGVSDDLIRLSVGIEEAEAIMADLAQALAPCACAPALLCASGCCVLHLSAPLLTRATPPLRRRSSPSRQHDASKTARVHILADRLAAGTTDT